MVSLVHRGAAAVLLAVAVAAGPGLSGPVTIRPTGQEALDDSLKGASLLLAAEQEERTSAQDLFAAARADYARFLGALYEAGYYSPVIHILIDGREAAAIAPLDAPAHISRVDVQIEPGPQFKFGRAEVAPVAKGTELPKEFTRGEPALSGLITQAAQAGVEGWRSSGHAKAAIAGQDIVANHPVAQLDAAVTLAPGPVVVFGNLIMQGYQRMRPRRLAKIAGLPTGKVFDPEELTRVRERLRRTGVFSAISLEEAKQLGPDNSMDITLSVAEQKPRRFGIGAEISSYDGAGISGYWMHRNLLGGAERLRVDGAISGIGSDSGTDYSLDFRLDRPATLTPDTNAFAEAGLARVKDPDFQIDKAYAGIGLSHIFSKDLKGDVALRYTYSREKSSTGTTVYKLISLPANITWDKRDNRTNAKHGFYLAGSATPFVGLSGTGSGAQIKGDARGYLSFGSDDRLTLAGRAQLGTVAGADISRVPSELRFWSGGGGTVRGQPYQSLGQAEITGAGLRTGAASLVALSAELRMDITDTIGAVAFVDAGLVSSGEFWSGDTASQSGAGLGVRYQTPIGPLRLDVAAPVSGKTGDGVQFYIGIGQAF